jgi:hypothetical protein
MLSAHQMSLVTYTLLVVSLLACYFHGFKHSVGVKIGVDDWTAKDLQVFFYKQGKVNLETSLLEDLGLNGHALFDNHVIDDAFLQSKMNLGRELDRKNILKAIEQLDDELTHRPKDLFEWRVSNRRLFRYISSLGVHGQVLWFRWYDHPGALDQFDQYIDDMPAVQFWTIWLFAPSYFHYKIGKSSLSFFLCSLIIHHMYHDLDYANISLTKPIYIPICMLIMSQLWSMISITPTWMNSWSGIMVFTLPLSF